jgi:hypothetical protein
MTLRDRGIVEDAREALEQGGLAAERAPRDILGQALRRDVRRDRRRE